MIWLDFEVKHQGSRLRRDQICLKKSILVAGCFYDVYW